MNERDVRQEVFALARAMGFVPITQTNAAPCPKCGALVLPPIGRPDILMLSPACRVCEVKVVPRGRKSFPFSSIRDEQRKWLDWWTESGHIGYIAIGTLEKPRRLWLIPWTAWRQVEQEMMERGRKSIPIDGEVPSLAVSFASYELKRVKGGWVVGDGQQCADPVGGVGEVGQHASELAPGSVAS